MNKKLLSVIFIAFFFCSVVVVSQISYCQTNTDTLTVTLNTPADQTTSSNLGNAFSYIPVINDTSDSFVSATLFINDQPTINVNSTDIINGTTNIINYDFTSNGNYTWNVQVTDTNGVTVIASSYFTLIVAAPSATPTAAPSPTPTLAATTPTATPTSTKQGIALNLFLIIGIVAAAAVVCVISAFFVTRKKVNEKSLRKFSAQNFQDWVIKKFNGKPGDPASGVDGFAEGGQPLLIKQSDNVSLAEVEGFVDVLAKGNAIKGTIVAFNFDKDAVEGKLKAMDYGIELQMLNIQELVNNKFSDKIKDIARAQVTFGAPVPPPNLTEGQETEAFREMPGELPTVMPSEMQKEDLRKLRVFVSYSNTRIIDQVKEWLEFLQYEYVIGDKEETPKPIPDNKFGLMKECDCAIITISAIEQERRYSGLYILNPNVLTEISAAYLKYNQQVILLVDRKLQLPSNLQGLIRIEYDGEDLLFIAAMDLQKILTDFKKI